jgi:hypothetical protein
MRKRRPAAIILVIIFGAGLSLGQHESERWLTVEVTDVGGRPLGRACVTVVPREGEVLFTKADKRGVAKWKKLAAGSYRVVVKVDGYEAQKREVMVGEDSETVAFALQPRPH